MPSPVLHSALGGWLFRKLGPTPSRFPSWSTLVLLGVFVFLSLLPDLDAVPGFLTRDLGRYHNHGTHSILVGTALAVLVGGIVGAIRGRSAGQRWFLIVFLSYVLHVLMDYFTCGRGVMLFWPLTARRFQSPVLLFYGLQWGAGLWSREHLWTLGSELLWIGSFCLFAAALRRRRKAVRPSSIQTPP